MGQPWPRAVIALGAMEVEAAVAMAVAAGKATEAMATEAAEATAMAAGKAVRAEKVVPMGPAVEKATMVGRAMPEAQAPETGMPGAARAARLEGIRLEVTGAETMQAQVAQAQVAQARATKAESAVTVKAETKAILAAAAQAADPLEVQAEAMQAQVALVRVPGTAAPEETPRAKAEDAAPMATRQQVPATESLATARAAKDEAAKGQERLKTPGAGTGVPETAREPAQPKRGPDRGTAKAMAPAKGTRKVVVAASEVASARVMATPMLTATAAKPGTKTMALVGTAVRGRVSAAA